jgi:hypothetical protein
MVSTLAPLALESSEKLVGVMFTEHSAMKTSKEIFLLMPMVML